MSQCSIKPIQGQGIKPVPVGGGYCPIFPLFPAKKLLGFFQDLDHLRPPFFSPRLKTTPPPPLSKVAPSFLPSWGHLNQLRTQERRAYPSAEAGAKP